MASFNFCGLPVELQQDILIQAAVNLRLSSDSFSAVYETMALVCKGWRDLLNDRQLYKRVKQQTFLIDPLSRYLKFAQWVRITGVENNQSIRCAVTLGDTLYVTERSALDHLLRIFVYDMNCTDVRHDSPVQRQITCTNRRPLVVNGLASRAVLIMPCPHYNCLYIVERVDHNQTYMTIHKLIPDGTVVLRWTVQCPWYSILSINISAYGAHINVLGNPMSYVYETASGDLLNALASVINPYGLMLNKRVLGMDETLTSFVDFPFLEEHDKTYMVAGDGHHGLLMNHWSTTLYDLRKSVGVGRELHKPSIRKFTALHQWYDNNHGLIFCTHSTKLRVMRVTH